jgi:accessory gene regulator B
MKKVADYLTDYIYKKESIKEEDYPIYNYGFQFGLELGFCLLICFIISAIMNAICEGIIAWGIFLYVRSYAGGIHLKKYRNCLICSCIVFTTLLILNSWKTLNCNISLYLSCLCVFIIAICSSIKTNNVDQKELNYFRSKLIKRLVLIEFIAVAFYVYRFSIVLSMISYSLSAITISVIIQYINICRMDYTKDRC